MLTAIKEYQLYFLFPAVSIQCFLCHSFVCLSVSVLLIIHFISSKKKVQVGKDQEKAQSEKDSHSKNQDEKKKKKKKKKKTIRYLYHENI